MLQKFKTDLKARLDLTLPAHQAHQKLMDHRKSVDQLAELTQKARESAVLLLIYPKFKELHTVFIQRKIYKGVHSGQIGFPGGKVEKADKSLVETALREANEELNIQADQLEVLGSLSPLYIPPSNFLVYPFVAFQESKPHFTADQVEVESYLECPLSLILGEDKLISTHVLAGGNQMPVKGFKLNEHLIWGATGMILKEFVEVLEDIKVPSALK